MALALGGIILSLVILITLAYRGHSVIAVAPLAAMIAVVLSGAPILASYTQVFMPALGDFIVTFFPLFITGAIFGKLMSVSGYAQKLGHWLSKVFGPNQAILVTALSTALLTYGGVSAWVVAFTIFPIAKSLFEAADIPRRLMPAAAALGIFTFATAALPGSPQIHNAIPTPFFETTTFAAPFLGIIGGAVTFGLGMLWLTWRQRRLTRAGESFSDLTEAERGERHERKVTPLGSREAGERKYEDTQPKEGSATTSGDSERPAAGSTLGRTAGKDSGSKPEGALSNGTPRDGLLGLLPILIVVAMNALFVYVVVPSANFDYLAEDRFGSTTIESVLGVWSVTIAMVAAIATVFLMRPRAFRHYVNALTEGAKNAVLPVFTTASEVGYGAVIASLAVFAVVSNGLFGISDNALVVSVLSAAGIAGLTGSSSGGLTIALETFGADLQTMAADQAISMELMHRATAMSSVSFDSLPHNGAIITLLLVFGLSHRESYKDIGVVTVLAPFVGVAVVMALGLAFGAF